MAFLFDQYWAEARFPSPGDQDSAERELASFIEATERFRENEDPEAQQIANFGREMASHKKTLAMLRAIFGNSPFLTQCVLRDIPWFQNLIQIGADLASDQIIKSVRVLKSQDLDEATTMRELRIAKRRMALTIALADIGEIWSWPTVTDHLSRFADETISVACAFALRKCAARGGLVLKSETAPEKDCGYFVLAMGKLGAGELNYSSDIDLICLFDPERIQTDDYDDLQSHAIRMTRTLAKILDERTADGYVFRVDLRLRPDPGSTPLAISVLAAETYYESLGQNWERAAMIKARVVAGDVECGRTFLENLRPFVWRKSLDFAAIEDIHSIKRQIHAHKGGGEIAVEGHNIKTGRGGIREIEFFAQTQQLIWGGRETALRKRRTIEAISVLVELGQVSRDVANVLEAAYGFFRDLEHRLQMRNDEQTQKLPDTSEEIGKLATLLGYPTTDEFRSELLHHLSLVQHHYGELFGAAPSLSAKSDPNTLDTLNRLGFHDANRIDNAIRAWHHGRVRATRSTRARELLTELTPTILAEIAKQPDPDATFGRFDDFLSGLPAGVQLFSMFQAFPKILGLIAEIMGEAPRLAAHLGRRPVLLDSVLSADFYDPLGDIEELAQECRSMLGDAQFFEDILDATRLWDGDKKFQVGIQLLRKALTPADASRHLSNIAETALKVLVPRVIEEFEEKHGGVAGGRFCILALGKLGSRELTPASDLDLIFVYDCDDLSDESDGQKPLAASQYYGRLGQRIINAIMARTAEGTLYEADMRLRPSGNKGPISTSLEGFKRYYEESAWTWEHMTLVRSRAVFDTHELGQDVEHAVRAILRQSRDQKTIAKEVATMRGRIEKQYKIKCPWAIKHVAGGLVDVDFISQYLVLAIAKESPEIIKNTSQEIIFIAIQLGAIDEADGQALIDAARLYQQLSTFLALAIEGTLTDDRVAQFSPSLIRDLTDITDAENFEHLTRQLVDTEARTRHIFERMIGPVDDAPIDSDEQIPEMD
jgi:glutamate-ammonia-ligase adenylyltransferase